MAKTIARLATLLAALAPACSSQTCPTGGGGPPAICSPSGTGTLSTSPDLGLGSMVFAISGNNCLSGGTCSVRPTMTVSNSSTGTGLPTLRVTVSLPATADAGSGFGFGGSTGATACDPADPNCVDITGSLWLDATATMALTATTGFVDVAASTPSAFDATFSVVLETPAGQEISIDNAHVTLTGCRDLACE